MKEVVEQRDKFHQLFFKEAIDTVLKLFKEQFDKKLKQPDMDSIRTEICKICTKYIEPLPNNTAKDFYTATLVDMIIGGAMMQAHFNLQNTIMKVNKEVFRKNLGINE